MNQRLLSLLIFIFLGLAIWGASFLYKPAVHLAPLPARYLLLGVVDLDVNHGISLKGISVGDDILVVLDQAAFINQFIPFYPQYNADYSKPFDLLYYGNPDGEIDNQSPIWNYLYAVYYTNNGAAFQIRHLDQAGFHAIHSQHLTAHGNHQVVLTDGDTRILYETNRLPAQ